MKIFNINDSLGFLLGQTNSLMRYQFNKRIKENGFNTTVEQWGILNIVKTYPGIIQSEIALKGLKDKTNVPRMLDLLEKKECLERKTSKQDRRHYKIFITKKGEELLNVIIPIAIEVNKQSIWGLENEEIRQLTNLLEKINNNLKNR